MRKVVVAVFVAVVALTGCSTVQPSSAPSLADPNTTGRELSTQFLTLLKSGDSAGLEAFLAPAFQIQRADGSGETKSEYLADPASITSFELGPELTAVQDGSLLTVRWQLATNETINGEKLATGMSPRLSTYVWSNGAWRMVSHANFNVIP